MSQTKIALITGGSRGLGKDMALKIAEKGLDVVITYLSSKGAALDVVSQLERLGVKAHALQLDSSDTKQFDAFFKNLKDYLIQHYGHNQIDFIVNNAGTGIYKPFVDTTEADFDAMMNIHIRGVYFLTQKALPFLNDGAGIINISSGLARFSLPGSSAYAPMKGAVEVFTRYLAKELSDRKIRANVVAPGAIGTDFGEGANRDDDDRRGLISQNTALGRVGEPEDIGGVVAFLCTDDAKWLNAQRIEVSGGVMI